MGILLQCSIILINLCSALTIPSPYEATGQIRTLSVVTLVKAQVLC